MPKGPILIGRSEPLNFIDFANSVPAKVDTGAYLSAIHCSRAKEIKRAGRKLLRADLLGHPSTKTTYTMEFPEYEKVAVKNSSGVREMRYKVKLHVHFGVHKHLASFTLADRTNNLMPVLIGRELLGKRFLVDVSRTNINRLKLRKIYRRARAVSHKVVKV
jgi:hypothetical protein